MRRLEELIRGRGLYVAQKDQTVHDVARLMASKRIGAIPVLSGQCLVGIFSERDLLTRVVAAGLNAQTTTVEQVMTRDVVVAEADEASEVALARMKQAGVRHLPVVAQGQLIGIVSLRDLLLAELEVKSLVLRKIGAAVQYVPPTGVMMVVWRCLACGHHIQGDAPPDPCPGCDVPREYFELVVED